MADTKITDLTSATAASGDELPANRAGADRKLRAEEIAALKHPTVTTDETIARYDGTAGSLQGSGVRIDDSNNVVLPNNVSLKWRNATDTADLSAFTIDSGNSFIAQRQFFTNGGLTPATAGDQDIGTTVAGLRYARGYFTGLDISGGVLEFDSTCMKFTAASSVAQIVRTDQIITQTSAYTGSTALAAQKLFDASTGLNGAVTVGPSITYMFETAFNVTAASTASHTSSFGFGGTAAVDRQGWTARSVIAAATSVPTAGTITRATATNIIHVATTLAQLACVISGKVVIGTSGTLIPSLTRSAGTVALVVSQDSYFRIWPIGSTSVTRVGNWS